VWDVVESDGALRLGSVAYREVWVPRQELVARCRRPLAALPWGRMPLHEPPNAACRCGIHAVQSSETAAAHLRREAPRREAAIARVMGTVALWGRVVVADAGWRGGVAYPTALLVPTGRWRRLVSAALWPYRRSPGDIARELEAYGVPVELVPFERPAGTPPGAAVPSLARTTLV